jgi:transglutaminase-like putative cysteine protease
VYEPLHSFNLSIYLIPPRDSTQALLKEWLAQRFTSQPSDTVGWLFALNRLLFESIKYERRDAEGIQDTSMTLSRKMGACRDLAVLLVEIARTCGLAARFVSGYVYDAGRSDQNADMHAWAEVFLPGAGWRGVDPTHGIFCDNAYVPVAHAVVAESVNPVQGSYVSLVPAKARLTAEVSVRRAD